jgi:FMN phosphatase YigB (HAD superfamily)
MKKPKVLFLDWSKTLSNSIFWSAWADEHHPKNRYFQDIQTILFRDNKDIIYPWMRGTMNSEDICKLLSLCLGIDEKIIFDELAISCANMSFCRTEVPELLAALKREGVRVVVATDNMDTFRRFTIPAMQLDAIFDDYLISSELGVFKGDTTNNTLQFFDRYLTENNLDYGDVMLVDDGYDKSGMYGELGFKWVHIDDSVHFVEVLQMLLR